MDHPEFQHTDCLYLHDEFVRLVLLLLDFRPLHKSVLKVQGAFAWPAGLGPAASV